MRQKQRTTKATIKAGGKTLVSVKKCFKFVWPQMLPSGRRSALFLYKLMQPKLLIPNKSIATTPFHIRQHSFGSKYPLHCKN